MNMSTENISTTAENTATPAEHTGGRTFTQDQVNTIVQERLARDREKQSEELGKKEQELLQREFRLNSREKLLNRGYPEDILDALNLSDEKAFDKALDLLDEYVKPYREEAEAKAKAAASAPKFTDKSEPRHSLTDPIRKAMNL